MALVSGARLGAYEILALVGMGGMGEVYRARDTTLHRDVALKILPATLAEETDRLARFTREAQTLAALNHPGIAHIYGLDRQGLDGTTISFIVMELVAGEDLAQRIARGPIPIDESAGIAAQIAEALETAHEHGIVHRDLKPANIKVQPDGTVKVLDFGLAKSASGGAFQPRSGQAGFDFTQSPTITTPAMTAAGVVLGTAAYMAPEQAKGKLVDKRADIWAFGVVLYEMITGRALFAAESVAETIGFVCTRDPDWSALPGGTPPRIEQLLRRCLTRDPRDRLRDVGEARILLAGKDEPLSAAPLPRRTPAIAAAAALGALALGVFGTMLVLRRAPAATALPLRRFELPAAVGSATAWPMIAPDGSRVAYIADNHLRVQALDTLESQDLGAVPVAARNIFWSPDGETIGFTADATVRTMPARGGPAFVVCRIPASGNALDVLWRSDNTILVAVWRDSLYKVAAAGGTPEIFLRMNPATEVDFHWVTELPGNRFIVGTHLREPLPEQPSSDHEQQELYDGVRRTVLTSTPNVSHFTYAPSGHLLFLRTDANIGVWAVPFKEGPLDLSKAVRVEAGALHFDAAADGTLIASIRPTSPSRGELVWVDRAGAVAAVAGSAIDLPEGPELNLSLSPDGRRAAYVAGSPTDVFVRDLSSALDTRLTFERHSYTMPSWFPSGNQILYLTDVAMTRAAGPGAAGTSFLGKVTVQRADGADRPRELTAATALPRVTPDGKNLVFIVDDNGRGRLHVAPLGPDGSIGSVQPFFRGGSEPIVRSFDVSRDGRLLAYVAEDISRRLEIFVTEFPSATGKWLVQSGANLAQFSPAGGELFFVSGSSVGGEAKGQFNVVSISSAPVAVGRPTKLFDVDMPGVPRFGVMGYAVAPDGRRILAARPLTPTGQSARRAVLIQNWNAPLVAK